MKIYLMLAIMPALLFSKTTALAGEEEAYLMGVGTVTCGKFAALYASNPEQAETAVFSWAQGYMSARNLESIQSKKAFRDLMGISIEQQQATIRSFCDAHPLMDVAYAVQALFSSLPMKTVKPKK